MDAIGVGVIGVGLWGSYHAYTYASDPRVRLVGICDLDRARARERARETGAEFGTDSPSELLSRSDIAAVSIATPDFAHRDLAVAAAEAGKHILCEKPLATTAEDARAILHAASANSVSVMVDFHNRFNPAFHNAKALVENGEIGSPRYVNIHLSDTIHVPTAMLSWASKSSVAWFLGSHAVDLVRWLTGSEVKRVYAVSRSVVLRARGVDTPDFIHMTLELEGGCVATVENTWILGDAAPAVFALGGLISCSEGHVDLQVSPHAVATVTSEDGYKCLDLLAVQKIQGRWVGFAIESIRHFVSFLAGETELAVTGEDGLAATRIIVAAEESARTGVPVDITPDWP